MFSGLKKVIRFIGIYGLGRTVVKVAGRVRPLIPLWWLLSFRHPFKKGKKIGIIGCGQFSYSTTAYFLSASTDSKIVWCCDINLDAAKSMAIAFGSKRFSDKCTEFLDDTDLVYIASNHSTHASYAIECLKAGCDVYIEKPISTTWEQFEELLKIVKDTDRKVYVGYNRPHSPSVQLIKSEIKDYSVPLTLSCFITGHFIAKDHWYRNPEEGTRICGNLGHWIDLAVHMLFWSKDKSFEVDISIVYSDTNAPSDNLSVALSTASGDLINFTFSTRSEPFEGVNESINFQQGDVIAKINDHRHVQIWTGEKYISKRYWHKNAGHEKAILQPFSQELSREWEELVVSNRLMLVITDMVKNLETSRKCDLQNIEN